MLRERFDDIVGFWVQKSEENPSDDPQVTVFSLDPKEPQEPKKSNDEGDKEETLCEKVICSK